MLMIIRPRVLVVIKNIYTSTRCMFERILPIKIVLYGVRCTCICTSTISTVIDGFSPKISYVFLVFVTTFCRRQLSMLDGSSLHDRPMSARPFLLIAGNDISNVRPTHDLHSLSRYTLQEYCTPVPVLVLSLVSDSFDGDDKLVFKIFKYLHSAYC